MEPFDLSLLNNMDSTVSRTKKKQFPTRLLGINSSFADVIKAKISFDTKFLGFEAILHKMSSISSNEANLPKFCQICSNVIIVDAL